MSTEGYLADFESEDSSGDVSSDYDTSEENEKNYKSKSDDVGLLKRTLKLSLNFQVKAQTKTFHTLPFLFALFLAPTRSSGSSSVRVCVCVRL